MAVRTHPCLAVAAAFASAATAAPSDDRCRIIRHLANGSVVESVGRPSDYGVSASASRGAATAQESGGSSSRSSVSVSSRSSSNRNGRAVASSSRTDDSGRIITVTRDDRGCTVVIDERAKGD